MQFLETLKLQSKLFFLFVLITFGLITVSVLGSIHISAMKKNLDGLYFGSLVPVVELGEIMQTYNNELSNSLHKSVRNELSPDETLYGIVRSVERIDKLYATYMSHYKLESEMEYVEYVESEIELTNSYFMKLHDRLKEGENLKKLNLNLLEKKVSSINMVVQTLIEYEVNVARYERQKFLKSYNATIKQLGLFLTLIFFGLLGVLFYVFRSIHKEHLKLQITTTKLKKANKKLENLSYTDVLTGLHNRRYFNYIYERELKRARRAKSYITFMMIDVDFFKQYNDIYGHIAGDSALKSVAKVLKERLKRPSDYLFRLGGEEFGVLLSETDPQNSKLIADALCEALRLERIEHNGSKAAAFLSISIGGVCCVADEVLDDDVFLSRADAMLYEAKEQGRNRAIITTEASRALPQHSDSRDEPLIA